MLDYEIRNTTELFPTPTYKNETNITGGPYPVPVFVWWRTHGDGNGTDKNETSKGNVTGDFIEELEDENTYQVYILVPVAIILPIVLVVIVIGVVVRYRRWRRHHHPGVNEGIFSVSYFVLLTFLYIETKIWSSHCIDGVLYQP